MFERIREFLNREHAVVPPRIRAGYDLPWGDPDFYPDTDWVNLSPTLKEVIGDHRDLTPASAYRTQPAIRICVNFLALNIAHTKLWVLRRNDDDDRDRVTDHPLPRVLDRPNPHTTGFDLIRSLVSDLALYDCAYWWKASADGAGQPQLYRIPPHLMEPKEGDIFTGVGSFEMRTSSGTPRTFGPEEIVHFHGYSALDTRVGVSPLNAIAMVLNEEFEAARWRRKFWQKGARMDLVIERPAETKAGKANKWTEKQRENFREGWRRFARGGNVEGETAILEDDMRARTLSFSSRDSEFIAGRQWALDVVATAYNIPLAMLSRKETSTFASMKEFHKILYTDVLGPWNAMIERTIDSQLVPDFGDPDLYVEFNIDEKLQGDFEEQANAARSSVQVPWMSVDDERAKRGLAALGPPYDKPARPSAFVYEGAEPAEDEEVAEPIRLEPVREEEG